MTSFTTEGAFLGSFPPSISNDYDVFGHHDVPLIPSQASAAASSSSSRWQTVVSFESFIYLDTNLFMLYMVWFVALFFLAAYALAVLTHIFAVFYSVFHLHRSAHLPADESRWPSVSIVKPLLGADAQLLDNLETAFTMDYTGKVELLCCVEDPSDPALGVVKTLASRYPDKLEVRLFDGTTVAKLGDASFIVNPMVRNMLQGVENARYDYIWISSSRCRMSGEMLRDMVARASHPKIGLVHQMPYIWDSHSASASPCRRGLGPALERLCFATSLARPYLALACLRVNCFTGMSYVFRRNVLAQVGGLRNYGRYLAEDFHLSSAVSRLGYRNVVAGHLAEQNNGPNITMVALKDRLVRWHRLRLSLIPFVTMILEPFQDCLIVGAAAAWALHFIFNIEVLVFLPLHILAWFCADVLLYVAGRRSCRCCLWPCSITEPMNPFVYVVAWLALQLLPFYIIFESLCQPRQVQWGRSTYRLSKGAVAHIIPSSGGNI